ncbi:hypothetical protein Tco_0526635 [Tanacetum coccineum]
MANNETQCSPSGVCLSESDSELLITKPWPDESKNEKRAKRWREEFEWKRSLFEIDLTFGINAFDLDKGTEVMKDKVSQEHVCKEEVSLCHTPLRAETRGKQNGDLVEMPSDAAKQEMDDHVPDEIDSAKGEQVPNHVVKKGTNDDSGGEGLGGGVVYGGGGFWWRRGGGNVGAVWVRLFGI